MAWLELFHGSVRSHFSNLHRMLTVRNVIRRTLSMSTSKHISVAYEGTKASATTVVLTAPSTDKTKPQNIYYEVHSRACINGESTYNDPETGYTVFTEVAHRKRGKCCGNKCRHCPFQHCNVKK